MKGPLKHRGSSKPKPAEVWALKKAHGGKMAAVFERWGAKWHKNTLSLLAAQGRLEEAMKDSSYDGGDDE